MKKLLILLEFLAKVIRFLIVAFVAWGCFYYAIPVGDFLFNYFFGITLVLTNWFIPVSILIFLLLMLPFIFLGLIWTELIEEKLIENYQNFKSDLIDNE